MHVKLTGESRGLIGTEQIRRMKRGAILINPARGPVVERQNLLRLTASTNRPSAKSLSATAALGVGLPTLVPLV
jgi:phosphoglycerate dehydrogenase-like enzyme